MSLRYNAYYVSQVVGQDRLLAGIIDGEATALADLLRTAFLSGAVDGDAEAELVLRPLGRVQVYGHRITWEDF